MTRMPSTWRTWETFSGNIWSGWKLFLGSPPSMRSNAMTAELYWRPSLPLGRDSTVPARWAKGSRTHKWFCKNGPGVPSRADQSYVSGAVNANESGGHCGVTASPWFCFLHLFISNLQCNTSSFSDWNSIGAESWGTSRKDYLCKSL